MSAGLNWVKLNGLLERLTQVEDEFLAIIEADPSVCRMPGALDVAAELKRAVESVNVARDAVDMQVVPPYDPHLLPPSHYVAEVIRGLPRAGQGVPPQVVEIHAKATAAWPCEGRYRIRFRVRNDTRSGTLFWYWGVESIKRLESKPETLQPPIG